MKKGYASLTAAVLLTMIGGFFKFGLAGYGFGAYVLWGAAGVCGAFWVLGRLRERWPRVCGVVSKILTYGVMIGCFLVLSTLAVVVAGGQAENDAGAQYAIVLGAGVNGTVPSLSLATRLEAALRYAGENPETVLILSGGQGSGERITEARCMYDWLTARGIPAERLLLEERASNTRENVGFSREIIEAREADFDGKVCLITETYHLCRAKLFAERAGLKWVTGRGCYTGLPVLTGVYYLRECVALWAAAVAGK